MKKIEEKKFLITALGILYSLKERVVTINESEQYLFCPRVVMKLKEKCCNKDIVNLVECGCELEDIKSLLPEKYDYELDQLIKRVLEQLKLYKIDEKKEFNTEQNINWYE